MRINGGDTMLTLTPVTLAAANTFVNAHHRHHKATAGHKFSIGCAKDGELVGVAIVGRPVSRYLDDGWTLEVNRLCTTGEKNACSILYAASARAAKAMGYRKIITYTLDSESGSSLRAAGWSCAGMAGGKGKDPVQIGSYRGFTMSVAFDSMWKTYTLTLKGQMTHRVELGSDARGNLVRIENALDKMPERLRSVQEQLENLYNQQAAAKAEVGKPFPQEQELTAKTARLIELDMELNLDGKGQPQPEQAIAKSARPSVLDRLKASPVHGAPEKPHKKEMEAR